MSNGTTITTPPSTPITTIQQVLDLIEATADCDPDNNETFTDAFGVVIAQDI